MIFKIIKKILFGLLIAVCLLSFGIFIYFTELLDIQYVVLKKGSFNLMDKENEFEFGNLRNKMFDIIIKFYKEKDTDYSNLFLGQIPYTINIMLKDRNNMIIKRNAIGSDNTMPKSLSNDYFEWTLMHFQAERGKKYKVSVYFSSDYKNFDTMEKEIYVEQHYDHPSAPLWGLFQRGFFIIFLITLILNLLIAFIILKKHGRRRE